MDNRKVDRRNEIRFDCRERRKPKPRQCKICKKDPYPNYFYCKSCHSKVSKSKNVFNIQSLPQNLSDIIDNSLGWE